jgi:myo-inositol-1(or 4)-monophosphatase
MPADDLLAHEIEQVAAEMARGAGAILSGCFRQQISIDYKDRNQLDPVTSADKDTQRFLESQITRIFPGHAILGEETSGEAESDAPSPDFLWVLDPLDGTTNFLNGLPVYATSIGVLYRGRPLVGAVYLPWPSSTGGLVLHCRRGGGCFANGEPVSVFEAERPVGNRLIGLPGSFSHTTRFGSNLKGNLGEPRTTGSIAYELAMTAIGSMQYAIFGAPRMWDVLGGAIAVQEANGMVMTRFKGEKKWHSMDSLVPDWDEKTPSLKELRQWVAPLVAGNQHLAPLIAHNLRPRFHPLARFKRWSRKLKSSRAGPQTGTGTGPVKNQ